MKFGNLALGISLSLLGIFAMSAGACGDDTTTSTSSSSSSSTSASSSSSSSTSTSSSSSSSTSSSTSSSSSSGSGSAEAKACADLSAAICAQFEKCAPIFLTIQYGDVATCEQRIVPNCEASFKAPGNTTTVADVEACVAALPAAVCDDVMSNNLPAACDYPAGTLADSAACAEDIQCQSSSCAVPSGSACGTCKAKSAAGGACAESNECEKGLTCENQACTAPGKMGDTCGAGQPPCLATLGCVGGTCQTPLALGAACTAVGPGEPQPCNLLKGEYCGFAMKCEAVKLADVGQACGFSIAGVTLCKGDGSCEGPQGSQMCVAKAADGAACNAMGGPQCQSPAVCVNAVCTLSDPATCM